MPTVSHFVYVDESGKGAYGQGLNSLWVTAALAIALDQMDALGEGLEEIRSTYFRRWADELKGADIPHGLIRPSSIFDVVKACADLFTRVGGRAWITGSQQAVSPVHLPMAPPHTPKQETRPRILERISQHLEQHPGDTDTFLLIWDLSDQQELHDFSRSAATFRENLKGQARSSRLIPAVVGGLSHDWVGLQLADVFANFALHYWGAIHSLSAANKGKATAFDKHIVPCLERDAVGKLQGVGLDFR